MKGILIKHVFISGCPNSIVERIITHNNNDSTTNDDLFPEEIADIKEYYANDEKPKKFSTVEELINDLKN